MRDKNVPISGPFIIVKALQFAKALGYEEFRGSNGWLEIFKKRNGIMAKVISDESKDVDDNDSGNWITETNGTNDVTDRTIRNSFAKAGFFVSNENSASTKDEDNITLEEFKKMWIQLREKEEINDDVLINDFLSLHSEAETSETLTESDILDSVKNKNNMAMNCDEDEDDEDGNYHDAEINKTSYDEMLKSFKTIRRGLQFEENTPEGVYGALQRCEMYHERKHFFKQKTQTKLTDFISN
ncbi:hypothetical protein AVEN_107746-1 [Araneus ventricosus]|uniref:HTH CENPB-type domain-containing protein n=1 Tax=Araneus ventricosus TaxID=182803 RepID=A0A4Y2F3M1_ARAVE|nr:hypothetical protein AVEN_107746-1 [Araneus ventricosus]